MQVVIQKEVQFYDDQLTAAQTEDGSIYVSINEVCSVLGLSRYPQQRRIQEHDVLGEGLVQLSIETAGGRQTVSMLRHDLVPLWLAGVQGRAVREDVRPKLKQFQLRAAQVLAEAFQEGRLTTTDPTDLFAGASPESVQAYQLAQAVLHLARNQLLLEQRLSGRIEAVESRLETVEEALTPASRYVTPDQASQISQAVKAVALAIGKKSGRNEFGAIYGELYRKFGITSYKELPARRFEEAMRFLTEWHENVTDSPLPF
jgi:hypothetical protein